MSMSMSMRRRIRPCACHLHYFGVCIGGGQVVSRPRPTHFRFSEEARMPHFLFMRTAALRVHTFSAGRDHSERGEK